MAGRILIAAIVGGALMFGGGFVDHMFLGWVGRHMKSPADESTLAEPFRNHFKEPGIYGFPHMPPGFMELSKDEQTKVWNELNERYKRGPSAIVVVAPTGEDMMSPMQLGGEFASNVLAALIAAIIVAMLRPDVGFAGRWVAVFLIGIATWVSVNASYFLWYRFPWPFVQDELLCVLVEWAAAGIAIAAIVRPCAAGPVSR